MRPVLRHTFSHYHLEIMPIVAKVAKQMPAIMEKQPILWYNLNQALEQGIAAPIKRLLQQLQSEK